MTEELKIVADKVEKEINKDSLSKAIANLEIKDLECNDEMKYSAVERKDPL